MLEFLFVFAMFLVLVAVGPFLVVAHHRYLIKRYDIPDLWDIARQLARQADEDSSVAVITQRVRRRMRGMFIWTVTRKKRLNTVHLITMTTDDVDAIVDALGVSAFVQDYADAYASYARKNGFEGDKSGPWEIYVVADPQCISNHPCISSRRPSGAHRPYLVTPASEDSGGPALIVPSHPPVPEREPGAVLVHAVTHPITPVSAAMKAAPMSEGDATTYLDYSKGGELSADLWMRDVHDAPALLRDGTVVAYLGEGPVKFGRGDDCSVQMTDRTVSRHHAILERRDGSWVMVPQEGRICWINDTAAAAPTVLLSGDMLGFGSSSARFEFRG